MGKIEVTGKVVVQFETTLFVERTEGMDHLQLKEQFEALAHSYVESEYVQKHFPGMEFMRTRDIQIVRVDR